MVICSLIWTRVWMRIYVYLQIYSRSWQVSILAQPIKWYTSLIPSQHLFTIETFSSFISVLKKHFILPCSDERIKLFCCCNFNIKRGRIELTNVYFGSLKKSKLLNENLSYSKIKLSLQIKVINLLRLLNTSILRHLTLQCYEQQNSQEVSNCTSWLIWCSRTTICFETKGKRKKLGCLKRSWDKTLLWRTKLSKRSWRQPMKQLNSVFLIDSNQQSNLSR